MKVRKERKTIKSPQLKIAFEKGAYIKGQAQKFLGKRTTNNSQPKQRKKVWRRPFNIRTEIELRCSTPACQRFKPQYGKIGIEICEITERAILKRIDSDQDRDKVQYLGKSSSLRKLYKKNSFEYNSEEQSKANTKGQEYGLQSLGEKGRKSSQSNTMSGCSDEEKRIMNLKSEAQYYKKKYGDSLKALKRIKNQISAQQYQFEMEKKLYQEQIRKLRHHLKQKSQGFNHIYRCQPYDRADMIPESFILEKSIQSSVGSLSNSNTQNDF